MSSAKLLQPERERRAAGRAGRAVARAASGFTLIELVMTVTVLAILTVGVVPLVKLSVKRQKEQQLRETLREIRGAIDQFHREAIVGQCGATAAGGPQNQQQNPPNPPNGPIPNGPIIDPRVKVMITDTKVFETGNYDCYPPDLETLVSGVNVAPLTGGMGGRGDLRVNATEVGNPQLATKKKVYLRAVPVDPMTGEANWELRSSYDAGDASSWGGENVFDVHSKSNGTALNGEKYSDW